MITLANIRDAIAQAKYINKKDQKSVLTQIDTLRGGDVSGELSNIIQKLLEHEAVRATEEAAKAEYELHSSADKAVAEMNKIVSEHEQALSKIEAEYEGALEKETGNSDKGQAEEIRKKLGI